jgi:hypothetical protein
MTLGLAATIFTMCLIGVNIVIAESSKQDVLGLFGELTPNEIADVFDSCERYMDYMDDFHGFAAGKQTQNQIGLKHMPTGYSDTQYDQDAEEDEEYYGQEGEVMNEDTKSEGLQEDASLSFSDSNHSIELKKKQTRINGTVGADGGAPLKMSKSQGTNR